MSPGIKKAMLLLLAMYPIGLAMAQARRASDLVLIRGGSFTMGSPESEPNREKDEAQHRVAVSDFLLARREVTQGEYSELLGADPSGFEGDDRRWRASIGSMRSATAMRAAPRKDSPPPTRWTGRR